MECLCPLCNGLFDSAVRCKICGGFMKDGGRIQDFYDDYSPYLSHNLTDKMDGEPPGICQHIFTCTSCGHDDVLNIRKILI